MLSLLKAMNCSAYKGKMLYWLLNCLKGKHVDKIRLLKKSNAIIFAIIGYTFFTGVLQMYSKSSASMIINQQVPSRKPNELKPMLNSERIKLVFGSYDIAVLFQDKEVRISNLHSQDIMRTLAIVHYSQSIPTWFQATHHTIYNGGSIGQTIKNHGFNFKKEDLYYGIAILPEYARAKMDVEEKSAAVYMYQLMVKNPQTSESIVYCSIVEVYSPLYLTLGDLLLLSGSSKENTMTPVVQQYLEELSTLDKRFTSDTKMGSNHQGPR